MLVLVDTDKLLREGALTEAQVGTLRAQAKESMLSLAINLLLLFGIFLATSGLIFWLADALTVASVGLVSLGVGAFMIRHAALSSMLGSALALLGAGMLIGGATLELVDKAPHLAAQILIPCAGLMMAAALSVFIKSGGNQGNFTLICIVLMALAAHIFGFYFGQVEGSIKLPATLLYAYLAALLFTLGLLLDLRFISGLAILPFAQMLDTGAFVAGHVYVFYSPETTLTIVQMAGLVAICLFAARQVTERYRRHIVLQAVLGSVVLNLCALVGSHWGDTVGASYLGLERADFETWRAYREAKEAAEAQLVTISRMFYSFAWAALLGLALVLSAKTLHRGLFNTCITFAAIHGLSQFLAHFNDQPFAYALTGCAAIALSWTVWKLNIWLSQKEVKNSV